MLIEALKTMLDQSWNGPIDADHFARRKAAETLDLVRQKADPLAKLRAKAEAGDAHAQWSLGFAYRTGEGVVKDQEEALTWYRKAADQGHAAAQCSLGLAYYKGEGVAKDKEEADRWFALAGFALAKAPRRTNNHMKKFSHTFDTYTY